jgi:hypothetical protein
LLAFDTPGIRLATIVLKHINLFQAIGEQAPDAFIFVDRERAIRVWNNGIVD